MRPTLLRIFLIVTLMEYVLPPFGFIQAEAPVYEKKHQKTGDAEFFERTVC